METPLSNDFLKSLAQSTSRRSPLFFQKRLANKRENFKSLSQFLIMSTPLGGGHIIFAFSTVRTLGFRSFEGKVFILSLPNLVWVFIGLIACMGLLLVKIGV